MKLTIEQPKLASSLAKVLGVIEKRNTIPILGNVVISADGGMITLRGTDLDIDSVVEIDADIASEGICTARADMLHGIVRRLPKGALINLEHQDDILRVTSGRSDFSLSTLPADDVPTMRALEYEDGFTVPVSEFAEMLDMTAFAMSSEETRYYLNGVYLHSSEGKARLVATDGHRLSLIDSTIEYTGKGAIIPRKTVLELRKILNDATGDLKVSISEHSLKFELDGAEIVTKAIDGSFPDYTRVIPTGNDKRLIVNADEVKSAAARVAEVATDRTRAVRIEAEGDTLTLQVNGAGGDVAKEVVDCQYDDEHIVLGVNAKYLAECLTACGSTDIEMIMQDSGSPVIIRPCGNDDVTIVQMPMRLQ